MLTDFGIARILESDETLDLTGTGMGVGTSDYMAPEQGLGHKVDHRADIYALGIIFYEMVTGRKPFQADTPMAVVVKQIHDPLPRPTEFAPNLPDSIEHILLKALAKKPEDRYQNMGAFANALENPGAKEKRRWKNPFASRSMAKTWRWLFAIFLLAGIVGAGLLLQRQGLRLSTVEATMDPAKAIQMVRNMTWTAQVNSQATATQNRANYLATQTVKALTPTRTPLPTATDTQLAAEYRKANEILQIIENREPDQFYDFNLGSGPWVSDLQYDSMKYKYNVFMWEPLEDKYSWAIGPKISNNFIWSFDLRLSEIGGSNPLFGLSFGGTWDNCLAYINQGERLTLHKFDPELSDLATIASVQITDSLLPIDNWRIITVLYLDEYFIYFIENELVAMEICSSASFPSSLNLSGHNTIKVEIDNVSIWDISDQSGKLLESFLTSATPQPASTTTSDSGLGIDSSIVRENDGMTMMYIPAGEFEMGSSADDSLLECSKYREGCNRAWFNDEDPVHNILLDSYWIDNTEITNSMFRQFIEATSYQTEAEKKGNSVVFTSSGSKEIDGANWQNPEGPNSSIDEFLYNPVVHISWSDANAYCDWSGARLPTEAEWEKAARGGIENKFYPWGDKPPTCQIGADNGAQFGSCHEITNVGTFSPNGYGVHDMAGNLWEWTSDWYDFSYYSYSPYTNPLGPSTGSTRVLRGGSWINYEYSLLVAGREGKIPSTTNYEIGFRCAKDKIFQE